MPLHERPGALRPVFRYALVGLVLLAGCASPSAPKPPSLHLPQPVRDLSLARSGDDVKISFTVPDRTTDGLPLRGPTVRITVCRQLLPSATCKPVDLPESRSSITVGKGVAVDPSVHWSDPLPPDLRSGLPRTLGYRVEVRNDAGRSAGFSDPAFVAAGAAPPRVESFKVEGTRPGVLLGWTAVPGAGDVLIERTQLNAPTAPKPTEKSATEKPGAGTRAPEVPRARRTQSAKDPATMWLQADPGNTGASRTLDGTVEDGGQYRYIAVRRILAQVGGRTLELRSSPSVMAEITWRDIYPPVSPHGLTAIGFSSSTSQDQTATGYAVDLVWEPVNDPRVTGYLVRRVSLTPSGDPQGGAALLTPPSIPTPAFHDSTALPSGAYRYEVTAVDAKGNASPPATAVVQPSGR